MPEEQEWANELRVLGAELGDIVTILKEMEARHKAFREETLLAGYSARTGLGLSMTQTNAIIGWLKGEYPDDLLRQCVPISNAGSL